MEASKTGSRQKTPFKLQPQKKSKIQEANIRVEELESKIINFINLIKKDAIEKENQQNLQKHYQTKDKDLDNESKEESYLTKKNFEEKFAEISKMPNKLEAEFNVEIPNHDYLDLLVKSAKDDLRSAYNKLEKSEAQEKHKIANENVKRLEGKIKSFVEILEKTINILEMDKKMLLEEELKIIIAKIDEEIPILELKYLKSISTQAKIMEETFVRLGKKANSTNKQIGCLAACSLKSLLEDVVLFLDEVKKKVFDLKNSQISSNLKFALEKLNSETSENIYKLEKISFFNYQKADEIVDAFNSFVLTLKQNAILLDKILNFSQFFYNEMLEKVFDKKLEKIKNRRKCSDIYINVYAKVIKNKSHENCTDNISKKYNETDDINTPEIKKD